MREDGVGKCSAYFCPKCFFGVKLLIKSALLLIVDIDNELVNCSIVTFCDSQFQLSWTHKLSSQSCVGGKIPRFTGMSILVPVSQSGSSDRVTQMRKEAKFPPGTAAKELLGGKSCWEVGNVRFWWRSAAALGWCCLAERDEVEREHVDGNPRNWEKEATGAEYKNPQNAEFEEVREIQFPLPLCIIGELSLKKLFFPCLPHPLRNIICKCFSFPV